ncbi:glutamine amidotransferase [Paludisphaera mucosa]|uniref:Glutamine amidotransferase n=1 Tax=Paludisphaera mucosa TaxID=3030827 RepID=A0ABT6F9U2_9BACT|nr:glutamine amidotransferase [Paludisphaera mucosa]MDG3004347.1 glutamine amidotransferase [Paludisphaera mucosa]
MTSPSIILGAPGWWPWAASLAGLALALIVWSYSRAGAGAGVRTACAILKALAFATLALILLEPLLSGLRPRRGANAFAVMADVSESLLIRDDGSEQTRGDWIRDRLRREAPWRARLGQDFDARGYTFDTHLRAVDDFDDLAFDGPGSAIGAALASLSKRFRGLPLAGALLFTDGCRTDVGDVDWSSLPPIYPVIPPAPGVARDVGVRDVSISQTNFESAPVVLRAEVSAVGYAGRPIVAVVVDEAGVEVQRQQAKAEADAKPLSFRFQFRPARRGVGFYQVRAFPADEEPKPEAAGASPASTEQTLANNGRLVVVDQGGGEYRVLYVGGRPNWEFKFLRRALRDDEQIKLVGLLRIARKQPKFDFQAARDRTNKFFQGFDNPDAETAEAADQPVLVRLDTLDEAELRDGFPKTAEELYRFHAIVVDDLEAGFFTPDQLALLRNFVAVRGGGLLMLGGPDSFADGGYDRTAVGELLPVYLGGRAEPADSGGLRLVLTREGWLQPWVRTRATEDEEHKRLAAMPPFRTLSRVGRIKPGAVVLAEVADPDGAVAPALAAQNFGKGRVAALLIGDLWRWGMRKQDSEESDLERSWRQTARWLVADVPRRAEVAARPKPDAPAPAVELTARVRDPEYRPLDDAKVAFKVALPGGESLTLDAEPDPREAGAYAATYVPKRPGAYRVAATAVAVDGSTVGEAEAGWAAQPAADEFARLAPDRAFLAELAAKTGGEVIDGSRLDAFVAGLPARGAPISEPWTAPLWDHPLAFLIAIACLTAEWGLRRLNGLA